MFDVGLQEMLVIGVIALLVFGPSKLPELGRMVGRALREFRRASDEFRSTVETNLHINDPEPVIQPPSSTAAERAGTTTSLPSETEPQFVEAVSETTAPQTTVTEAAESTEPYCGQRGSRLFHRRECSWVSRIPEMERVYLKRLADARDQGLRECPVCEPWEPA
jgi:TatA/E family protein of Tat protein translocase